jgi:hypothetical protein
MHAWMHGCKQIQRTSTYTELRKDEIAILQYGGD